MALYYEVIAARGERIADTTNRIRAQTHSNVMQVRGGTPRNTASVIPPDNKLPDVFVISKNMVIVTKHNHIAALSNASDSVSTGKIVIPSGVVFGLFAFGHIQYRKPCCAA